MTASLETIATLLHSGATEQAWALFVSSGYEDRGTDQAVHALRGDLLKAQGRLLPADERRPLFLQAAASYARAHGMVPSATLAVSAATLRLLAGDREGAKAGGRHVLAMLDGAEAPTTATPYVLATTRAEALLLLGDIAGAQDAMAEAIRAEPDNWDMRSATITQLTEILDYLPADATWLNPYRAPSTLHYTGHMALQSGGPGESEIAALADGVIRNTPIGFAYGTAAPGGDIIIAERVVAAGGKLTVLLPCPVPQFERHCVTPAGEGWVSRFRALLGQAHAITIIGDGQGIDGHDRLAMQLCGQVAMGEALLHARRLGTGAHQLAVLEADEAGAAGDAGPSRALAQQWSRPDNAHQLAMAPETQIRTAASPVLDDPARGLHVAVSIRLPEMPLQSAAMRAARQPVWQALGAVPPGHVQPMPDGWLLLLDDPAMAAKLCLSVLDTCRAADAPQPGIGIAYGMAMVLDDATSGQAIAYGPLVPVARQLAELAPAGAALIVPHLTPVLAIGGMPDLVTAPFDGSDTAPVIAHMLVRTGESDGAARSQYADA